jgi:hypothetical protein
VDILSWLTSIPRSVSFLNLGSFLICVSNMITEPWSQGTEETGEQWLFVWAGIYVENWLEIYLHLWNDVLGEWHEYWYCIHEYFSCLQTVDEFYKVASISMGNVSGQILVIVCHWCLIRGMSLQFKLHGADMNVKWCPDPSVRGALCNHWLSFP